MSRRISLVTLRIRAGANAKVGTWIVSANGEQAFRVLAAQEGMITCARQSLADMPKGALMRQWREVAPSAPPRRENVRRTDHLRAMLRRGVISEREFAAATRFRDTLERAEPSVPVAAMRQRGGGRFGFCPVSDGHLRARDAVLRAVAAVGDNHAPVLHWFVARNGSISGFAEAVHTHKSNASEALRATLNRLAYHYDPPVTGRCR